MVVGLTEVFLLTELIPTTSTEFQASSQWLRPPPSDLNDLETGEQYRLVFVTSTTRNATSSNIADYNAFVNTAAALNSDLAGISWTAIASTTSIDARDTTSTTGTGVPIYLLDDTLFVSDYTALWDGSARPSLNITEQGGTFNSLVWTGTSLGGTKDAADELGDGTPRAGKSDVTSEQTQSWWISRITASSSTLYPLFAISEVLTVPPSGTMISIR